MNQKIDWRNRTNVGFIKRSMGLHEGSKEVLACPHNTNAAFTGCSDRAISGFGCCALYLHTILTVYY